KGVQTTSAILGGGVIATAGNLGGVTIFYGPQDGSTNAGSWANSTYLGPQSGAFSTTVAGLSLSTLYYFTAQATNSGGVTWASPSLSFTTLAPSPGGIINLPATSITTTTATLGGQVLSTGGDTPNVTLFYGPSDGGTTPSAWSNSVALGPQSG